MGRKKGQGKWKPGESGNAKGRVPMAESMSQLLREWGEETFETTIGEDGDKRKRPVISYKKALIKRMWIAAIKGNPKMAEMIFNRVEGPVKQVIEQHTFENQALENEVYKFIRGDLLLTKQYVHPWYQPSQVHRDIAAVLKDENITRAMFVMPPQHGKTELLCKTFPAHFLAENPDKSIIATSYNQEYVNKLSVKCRDYFNDPKFQMLWGNTIELHPEQQTKHEWLIKSHNGGAVFSGVGGTITGNPADILLIDDVVQNYEEASSKIKQESIWEWYNTVVGTRLQGSQSRIIIVMTRWIKNDLIGKILKQEEIDNTPENERFKIYTYPAILDVKGQSDQDYENGRPLWPEKKDMKFLMERYRASRSTFKTMWQCNPRDLEGKVIKPEWIKIENDIKSLGECILSCRGWDFGYTESGNATVGSRIDVFQKGELLTPILMDVKIIRKDPTEVEEFVVKTALEDGKGTVLVGEGGGTQMAMIKRIARRKELMDYEVRMHIPTAIRGIAKIRDEKIVNNNKVARAISWVLKLEDGVFRLLKAAWNEVVVQSFKDFSEDCEEDDIEDSVTITWKTLFGEKE